MSYFDPKAALGSFKSSILDPLKNTASTMESGVSLAGKGLSSILFGAEQSPSMAQGIPTSSLVGHMQQQNISPTPNPSGVTHLETSVVTPTPLPGQEQWAKGMSQKTGKSVDYYRELYKQATLGKGSSGVFANGEKVDQPQVLAATTVQPATEPAQDVLDFLNQHILPITRKAGIPDAVAAGQFAQEGRMSGKGAARNNYFNYEAYDGKEDQMPSFNSPEESAQTYANLILHDPRFVAAAKAKNDPVAMIKAIKQAGYATDPYYAEHVMSTPEFQYFIDPDTKKKLGL